jgi:TonB-dependent starch-binding outer membrane protein SusC
MKNNNMKFADSGLRWAWSIFLLPFLMSTTTLFAINITGRVLDNQKEAIVGATVRVKGTSNGTATDLKGMFTLNNVLNTALLEVSYIGYLTQEIAVDGRNTIDIVLLPNNTLLDQVVVVGYGSQRAKDNTGAIGVSNEKDFGDVVVSSSAQLLQGKLAGVQVLNNDGIPGSEPIIIVRGTGSFTSASPLYVIDGIQSGEFNNINPNDIESITVLKDASSVAIFGASGANGVVMITTKRAKSGTPRVTYDAMYGTSKVWKTLDLMNAKEYIDLVTDIQTTLGSGLTPKLESPDVLVDRTDWQDAIYRTGKLTSHSLSIAGGSERMTYGVSAGYTDQQSILGNFKFKRGNLRLALEEKLWNSRIKLGQTLYITYTGNRGNNPSFTDALRMPTYAPILDPSNLGGYSKVTTTDDLNDAFNPITTTELRNRRFTGFTNMGQFFGELQILKGLKYRHQSSFTYGSGQSWAYDKASSNGNLTFPSQIEESYYWFFSPLIENLLYYDKAVGKHRLGLLAGQSWQSGGRSRSLNITGSPFQNDEIQQIGLAEETSLRGAYAGRGTSQISYFSRANYTLSDKYIFTATIRTDANSAFGKNNRFGTFPSLGLGWLVSEENFLKNSKVISNLKLRASWGKSGNANIGQFQTTSTVSRGISGNNGYTFGPDKIFYGGVTIAKIPNPNLRWEETTQTDFGFDAGFWQNKVTLAVDLYNRLNDGLLIAVPIPLSTGVGGVEYLGTSILDNKATARNKGIELSLGLNNSVGAFSYGINGNFSYNNNEVLAMGPDSSIINGGNFADVVGLTRTQIGSPIGSYFGYRVDHVASTQAEVDALNAGTPVKDDGTKDSYQTDFKPGDIIFKDLDKDGIITEKDQEALGSPMPKFQYGGSFNAGYKGLDFTVSLQGLIGSKIANGLKYYTEGATRPFNSSRNILNRWKKDGDVSPNPRAGQNANGNLNLRASDRYIESGDFLRIRNITLGYTLPKSLFKNMGNLRIYATAQNAFTFTKYTGYDPEVSFSNNDPLFNRGIDLGQYPQPKSFIFGLSLGL